MPPPEHAPAPKAPAPKPRLSEAPTADGRFGSYGGAHAAEALVAPLRQLAEAYTAVQRDRRFWDDLRELHRTFVGRPTPLCLAQRLTDRARARSKTAEAARIWLKREDLAHTGSHHINNALGQAMLAVRTSKRRVIAETGAGQHGVATAAAAARFGLACEVSMGAEDARRQRLNVARINALGARVVEVHAGSRTLRDAMDEAFRDWAGSADHTHYTPGSVVGPHPYPTIVRDFQSIIGTETKAQCLRGLGKLPDAVVACVGGGSNAAGMFYPFIDDEKVQLVGVEGGGRSPTLGDHAASLCLGSPGILHGARSYVLQDGEGQAAAAHSCAAGLDYPGAGPEHAYWKDAGRVRYAAVRDDQALDAFALLTRTEGIIPALEAAHAIAEAVEIASRLGKDQNVVVCLSGRGDKDVDEVSRLLAERAPGADTSAPPA